MYFSYCILNAKYFRNCKLTLALSLQWNQVLCLWNLENQLSRISPVASRSAGTFIHYLYIIRIFNSLSYAHCFTVPL